MKFDTAKKIIGVFVKSPLFAVVMMSLFVALVYLVSIVMLTL